jgi:2'-5' RNA ligase
MIVWEDEMANFRGFIAVDIDATQKIVKLGREIKQTGANVKLVEAENIHITLKFLGDTDEALIGKIEEIMKNAVKGLEPFKIKLRGAGVFPNPKYIKVIWVGMEDGQVLGEIANKIDEQLSELGFDKEKRKFSAHLTIARVRNARNKDQLLRIIENYKDFEFTTINIDSIKLKKSDLTPKGPIYSNLIKVEL